MKTYAVVVILLGIIGTSTFKNFAQTIDDTFENIQAIAWNPTGTVLAFGAVLNNQDNLWFYYPDTNTFDSIANIGIMELAWSPDNSKIIAQVGDINTAGVAYQVFDVATKSEIARFNTSSNARTIIQWNSTSTQIAVMAGNIQIYDLGANTFVATFGDLYYGAETFVWDSENNRLYVTKYRSPNEYLLHIWDTQTNQIIHETLLPSFIMGSDSSSDNSKLALASNESSVYIYDIATSQVIKTLTGTGEGVIGKVIWHPDNITIAAYGFDGKIYIWNSETGMLVAQYSVPKINVSAFTWRPETYELTYSPINGSIIFDPVEEDLNPLLEGVGVVSSPLAPIYCGLRG
jgi:WD40 repeat protein